MKRYLFIYIAFKILEIIIFIFGIYKLEYIQGIEDVLKIPILVNKYTNKLGVNLIVGNQTLLLAIDTLNEGIRLFQDRTEACNKGKREYFFGNTQINDTSLISKNDNCYNPKLSSSSNWCYNIDKCQISLYKPFKCEKNKEFPDPEINNVFYSFLHFNERTYDGITKIETALEGNEMITIPWIYPTLKLNEFPIKLIRNNLSTGNGDDWPSFHSFDGFIGFVGSSISCRGVSLWSEFLFLYNSSRYSFDVNFENESSSSIYLNDIPNNWNSDLILWSEPKQSGSIFDDSLTLFQIYNIKLCESMIMQDVSSNWLAALDLSSTCISIPPFLFTRILKWIPIECPDRSIPTNNSFNSSDNIQMNPYSSLCIVKEKPLPTISFELNQLYFKKNPIIIFLNDYIIHYNNVDYLCILNSTLTMTGKMKHIPNNDDYITSYYYPTLSSSNTPLILFGTLFLKSYGIIVDSNSSKVGFYPKYLNKQAYSQNNNNCLPKKECIGNSKYQSSLNECIPPDCSDWILYNLDEKTNTCIISDLYPFLITFIVVIFTSFELYIMYLKQFILDKSSLISNP